MKTPSRESNEQDFLNISYLGCTVVWGHLERRSGRETTSEPETATPTTLRHLESTDVVVNNVSLKALVDVRSSTSVVEMHAWKIEVLQPNKNEQHSSD